MQAKPVTVETEMRAEGKAERREGEVWKRCWKYGEAARNIFLSQRLDIWNFGWIRVANSPSP